MAWFKKWFKRSEEEPKNEVIEAQQKDSKKVANKYHVSQNKDEQSSHFKAWRVRKEGSDKTIQYFKTQKEAVDFAQTLAQRHHASVVIHKVDGSIRKQKY